MFGTEFVVSDARSVFLDAVADLKLRDKTTLVFDAGIAGLFDSVVDPKILVGLNIVTVHVLPATSRDTRAAPKPVKTRRVVFVIRPDFENVDLIMDMYSGDAFDVLLIPHRSLLCERAFEENGFRDKIRCGILPIYLLPMREDLLIATSAEMSCLPALTTAIGASAIKVLAGTAIPVGDLQCRGHNELIIFDRSLDLLTPLLTQTTYEGLIGEILTVDYASVSYTTNGNPQRVKLDDDFYTKVRHNIFTEVPAIAKREAERMSRAYAKIEGVKNKEATAQILAELSLGTKEIMMAKHIEKHVEIMGVIQSQINDAAFRKFLELEQKFMAGGELSTDTIDDIMMSEDIVKILRLLCINSIVSGGLPDAHYEHVIQRAICKFGFQHLATFAALERAGLLRRSYGPRMDDMIDGADTSELYLGYSPPSVTIIDKLFLRPAEPTFLMRSETERMEELYKPVSIGTPNNGRKFVLFNDITMSEYATLKRIAPEVVVITASILDGNSFIQKYVSNENDLIGNA